MLAFSACAAWLMVWLPLATGASKIVRVGTLSRRLVAELVPGESLVESRATATQATSGAASSEHGRTAHVGSKPDGNMVGQPASNRLSKETPFFVRPEKFKYVAVLQRFLDTDFDDMRNIPSDQGMVKLQEILARLRKKRANGVMSLSSELFDDALGNWNKFEDEPGMREMKLQVLQEQVKEEIRQGLFNVKEENGHLVPLLPPMHEPTMDKESEELAAVPAQNQSLLVKVA